MKKTISKPMSSSTPYQFTLNSLASSKISTCSWLICWYKVGITIAHNNIARLPNAPEVYAANVAVDIIYLLLVGSRYYFSGNPIRKEYIFVTIFESENTKRANLCWQQHFCVSALYQSNQCLLSPFRGVCTDGYVSMLYNGPVLVSCLSCNLY